MKNYVVKKNEDFILGYKELNNFIKVKYANSDEEYFIKTEESKENLDSQMMYQYENYNYNPVMFLRHKDLTTVLPAILGFGACFTMSYAITNEGIALDDILISGSTFAGIAFITSLVLGAARAEKSERDHDKDTLFVENLELLKEKLKDEEFCKHLPRSVRKKVIDIKTAGEDLSLNAANNFNLKQMEKLVSACQKEKTKVRTR